MAFSFNTFGENKKRNIFVEWTKRTIIIKLNAQIDLESRSLSFALAFIRFRFHFSQLWICMRVQTAYMYFCFVAFHSFTHFAPPSSSSTSSSSFVILIWHKLNIQFIFVKIVLLHFLTIAVLMVLCNVCVYATDICSACAAHHIARGHTHTQHIPIFLF